MLFSLRHITDTERTNMYTISNPLSNSEESYKEENLAGISSLIEEMLERGDWVNISLTKGDDSFKEVITISKDTVSSN